MAEAPNITDEDSFETWLNSHDEKTTKAYAAAMAGRVALRVLPNLHEIWDAQAPIAIKIDVTVHSLRCHIISGVARKYPTPEMKQAAASALSAAASALSAAASTLSAAESTLSAARSAYCAADSAFSAANYAANYAYSAAFFADSAARSAADIWVSVQADAMALHGGMAPEALDKLPLWLEGAPDWFVRARNDLRRALQQNGPHWNFWLDWFAAKAAGEPMERLGIAGEDFIGKKLAEQDDAFWDAGAEAIGTAIDGWVGEWEATRTLSSIEMVSIGSSWQLTNEFFVPVNPETEGDSVVADKNITLQLHNGIKAQLNEVSVFAERIRDGHGWEQFDKRLENFSRVFLRPTQEIPEVLGDVYSASLDIASCLDADDRLRANRGSNYTTCLDAEMRQELELLVLKVATFIRRFPTIRELDDDAGSFFGQMPDRLNARLLAEAASEKNLITDEVLEQIARLIDALENEGHLSQKAGKRGIFSARNLVLSCVSIAGGIYLGAIGSAVDFKSAKKISEFLTKNENAIYEMIANEPPDIRHATRILIEKINEERENNPPIPKTEEGVPLSFKRDDENDEA